MIAREFMKQERDKHFCQYKDSKMALYVSGIKSDDIVASFEEYDIAGIMDAYPVIESAYGKPLLTFEDAVRLQVEIIIIISPVEFYEIIRKRLSRFCRENSIKLLTLDGVRLALEEDFRPEITHPALWLKENELKQKIACHQKICMPIHQTLWTLLLENYSEGAVDEKKCPKKWVFPRLKMIELCIEIWKQGKELFLINDTGLDEAFVKETLKKIGIIGYTKLYSLREIVKSDVMGYNDTLFIGNPKHLTGIVWQFDIGRIYSIWELSRLSVYGHNLVKENMGNRYARLKRDIFCAKMFDSPFCLAEEEGKGVITNARDIGFTIVAPYVCDFLIWFVKKVRDTEINHILFGSRDGYLMKQLYDMAIKELGLKKMPAGTYLYVSRLASLVNNIKEDKDIYDALKPSFGGGMEDLLINRFLLDPTEVEAYDYGKMEDKEAYVLRHRDRILKKAKECREHYKAYINKLDFASFKKIAFFDLAASGSCQKYLEKVLGQDLKGLYFYRIASKDKEKGALDIESFGERLASVEANMLFMEIIFSSPEGTFQRIGTEGEVITIRDSRTEEQKKYCEEMQRGILEYCKLVLKIMGTLEECKEKALGDGFLDYLYKGYTIINVDEFKKYVQVDEFQYECFDIANLYRM